MKTVRIDKILLLNAFVLPITESGFLENGEVDVFLRDLLTSSATGIKVLSNPAEHYFLKTVIDFVASRTNEFPNLKSTLIAMYFCQSLIWTGMAEYLWKR